MLSHDTDVKTNEIHFLEGNENEKRFNPRMIYLDSKVYLRSENSILSLLSRIRTEFKVRNNEIHFIGLDQIHYVVILRSGNCFSKVILPIKKSRDELTMKAMLLASSGSTDLSTLDDICKKVVDSHSIIKKGKRVFKPKMYYYKLMMGETNQDSLNKFHLMYDIKGRTDIGDFSRLVDLIARKMELIGVNDENS